MNRCSQNTFPHSAHRTRPPRRVAGLLALTGLALLRLPGTALALPQEDRPADKPLPMMDVYVDDSLEASEAMRLGERLAAAGKWAEAAAQMQEVIERWGDKLAAASPGAFEPVSRRVERIIFAWPTEGLQAYRARFEAKARARFEAALAQHDLLMLCRTLDTFFCTRAAVEASLQTAELAVESGVFGLAQNVLERLKADHPDVGRPEYASRLDTLQILTAETAAAAVMDTVPGARSSDASAATTVTTPPAMAAAPSTAEAAQIWKGRPRSPAQIKEDVQATFSLSEPRSDFVWPMLRGSLQREGLSPCTVDEPSLLWRRDYGPAARSEAPSRDEQPVAFERWVAERARFLSVHPLIVAGVAILQYGDTLSALSLDDGRPLWSYSAPAEKPGDEDVFASVDNQWDSPTADRTHVYAVIPSVQQDQGFEMSWTGPQLACLSLADGRVIWRLAWSALGAEHADVTPDSAPVLMGDILVVTARRRRTFGFEDCYLYRFSAVDGRYLSRSHLGSATTGAFGDRRLTSAVCGSDGRFIFAGSQLGTIAAIDPWSGKTVWLREYDRSSERLRIGRRFPADVLPWHRNPIIVRGSSLYCLPADAEHLLTLDARTGRIRAEVDREELTQPETLIGINGNLIFTLGENLCAYNTDEGRLAWSAEIPASAAPFGLPLLVGDGVWMPSVSGLSRFRLSDGFRVETAWDQNGRGGNLVASARTLLVASDSFISAYVKRSELWQRFQSRMAASPDDPVPALEFAEVALRDGRTEEARQAYQTAWSRVQAREGGWDDGLGRRLFSAGMAIAEASSRDSAGRVELDDLFDKLGRCAWDPATHLDYRLKFAQWYERAEALESSVRLYQQILRDESLRDLHPLRSTGVSAAEQAEREIDRLVRGHGALLYAPYESMAERMLTQAIADGDLSALSRVYDQFPNASSAGRALMARAKLLYERGDRARAVKEWSDALVLCREIAEQPSLVEKIAKTLWEGGDTTRAMEWLRLGARRFADAGVEWGGETLTYARLVARLSASPEVQPSRPSLRLPLAFRTTYTLPDHCNLLRPAYSPSSREDFTRFYARADNMLLCSARNGDPLWEQKDAIRGRGELLLAREDIALFASEFQIVAVEPVSGRILWSQGEPPAHLNDPNADWEGSPIFLTHIPVGNRIISLRDHGHIESRDLLGGNVQWRADAAEGQAEALIRARDLVVSPDWVSCTRMLGGLAETIILDAETGAKVRTLALEGTEPVARRLLTFDGRMLSIGVRRVACTHIRSGRLLWTTVLKDRVREGAILPDVDGLYLSDDGRRIQKIDLATGDGLWISDPIARGNDESMALSLLPEQILVTTDRTVASLDPMSGQLIWEGTVPAQPSLAFPRLGNTYLAILNLRPVMMQAAPEILLYLHRGGSGVVPDHGLIELSGFEEVREFLLLNDAIVIQGRDNLALWRYQE